VSIDIPAKAGRGKYKGRIFKSDDDMDELAEKAIDALRAEGLPVWQAKEVLKKAIRLMDWEPLQKKPGE